MKLRNLIKESSYSNETYEIIDSKFIPPYKSSTIYDLSKTDIQNILNGMRPNMPRSEDDKVKYGWTFKFNNNHIGVWDYKDSGKDNIFSAYGNIDDLIALFGKEHVQSFHINHTNDKKYKEMQQHVIDNRIKNFNVKIKKVNHPYFENEIELSITHSGNTYTGIDLSKEEAKKVVDVLSQYFNF